MGFKNAFYNTVKRCIAFTVIATLTLSGCGGGGGSSSGGSGTTNQIERLTATAQADGTIYYTGSYQGTALRFAHRGEIGHGLWAVYAGTPGDRIRVTISDTEGVKEVLSMDKGSRTTINYVGSERIEYRTYLSDRFVLGSVLYRMGNRWMQGLMFTEAFGGYINLVSVTDVTVQINQPADALAKLNAKVETTKFGLAQKFSIISQAHASWYDDAVTGAANVVNAVRTIRGTTWGVMQTVGWNGLATMTGIAAATLGPAQTGAVIMTAGGAVVTGAGAILTLAVAAAPFVAVVAIGYVIGSLASDRRDQLQVANAADGSNSPDYDAYNNSPFNTLPTPIVPEPVVTGPTITPTPMFTCNAPQVPVNGVCVNPALTCTAPLVPVNGACVMPTPRCNAPQVPVNGVCVNPALTCTAPLVPVNGACVMPTPRCNAPLVPVNGVCVAPTPVACQVGAWTAWDACSATCGGGTQDSFRQITTQPANGGTSCPPLTRSQACNTQACIIGVTGTWNYTTTATYTVAGCTQLNNGPEPDSMTLTEVAGVVRNSTGTRVGTRTGNTLAMTWSPSGVGVTRSETWTWNGANTLTGSLTAMCLNPSTRAIKEEIKKPFIATRN